MNTLQSPAHHHRITSASGYGVKSHPIVVSSVAVFAALLSFACNGGAAIPPAEKLLPDDTLAVISTPDFARTRELYRNSAQARFWDDPAMKPFKDKFISRCTEELIQPLERELGVKFDAYTNLLQGQATFALTQNGWQGTADPAPAVLLLVDTKDKSSQLKTNLAELRKKWVDAGKPLKTEKIRGLDFFILPVSDRDIPQTLKELLAPGAQPDDSETNNAPKSELVFGQFESLLIVSTSTKPVEKVAAHLTGSAMPALGDVPTFEANRLALFRDAPFYGWANLKSFLDLLIPKPSAKDAEAPNPFAMFSPDKVAAATGLNGLKTLAFAIRTGSDGSLFQVFVGAPEADRRGLLKILPGDGKESGPPPFVPSDVVKFQRCRVDGAKAWAVLEKVMSDLSPQLLSGLNFALDTANAAAKEKDPAFDIRKNLFGNLGDDMIAYQKAPRGATPAELETAPSLFLLGSPHAGELAAAVKNILVLMGQQTGGPNEREFLGRKIYSIPLPAMPLPSAGPSQIANRTLSYASSGSYVAITTDAATLEEYLRSSESQQKTLRQTPGLAEAAQKVGGLSTGWFGYENQLETSRATFEALRKSGGTNATETAPLPGMAFPNPKKNFQDWMDFSLLPPFEQISKYFYFSVYAVRANADGLTFKLFAPTPPQLKK